MPLVEKEKEKLRLTIIIFRSDVEEMPEHFRKSHCPYCISAGSWFPLKPIYETTSTSFCFYFAELSTVWNDGRNGKDERFGATTRHLYCAQYTENQTNSNGILLRQFATPLGKNSYKPKAAREPCKTKKRETDEEKRNRRNKRPKFNNTQWSRCVDAFPWPCPCLSSNQTNKRNEILWFFRFAFLHLFGWRRRIEFMICLFAAALDEKLDDQKQTSNGWRNPFHQYFPFPTVIDFGFAFPSFTLPNKTQMKTNQLKCIFISQQFAIFSLFPFSSSMYHRHCWRRPKYQSTTQSHTNVIWRTYVWLAVAVCRIFRADLLKENRIRKY